MDLKAKDSTLKSTSNDVHLLCHVENHRICEPVSAPRCSSIWQGKDLHCQCRREVLRQGDSLGCCSSLFEGFWDQLVQKPPFAANQWTKRALATKHEICIYVCISMRRHKVIGMVMFFALAWPEKCDSGLWSNKIQTCCLQFHWWLRRWNSSNTFWMTHACRL